MKKNRKFEDASLAYFEIEVLEDRYVLSHASGMDADTFDSEHSHTNCTCPACTGFHAHPLFAPGTSPEYVAQFEHHDHDDSISEFRVGDRFNSTASNGGGLAFGDPTTITWSIVPDGTAIAGFNGEDAAPSNLVETFRGYYGDAHDANDFDYQGEAWFEEMEDAISRWNEVSGLTYVYEPNDDGVDLAGGNSSGVIGVRGDVRISGHRIDGNSGVLAYNFFPDTADMVIDTADNFYENLGGDSIRLRNVIAHEIGHGWGSSHVESNNASFLMEPFINTSFDGPQFDDVLGSHRAYGDNFEGNDTSATATDLGTINSGDTVSIGTDSNDTVVAATDTDFISIDDDSDVDFLSFTINAASEIDISLIPQGPTYNEGAQNGSQSSYVTSEFSDLTLQVIDTDGQTVLFTSNATGLGGTESILEELDSSGTYFIQVSGAQNMVQMYRLDVNVTEASQPAGITVTQSDASTDVTEGGPNDTYEIVLDSQPTSDVTVTFTTGDQVDTDPASIVFTTDNWDTAQTITVSAIDDDVAEGDHSGLISHSVSSSDLDYDGFIIDDITVNVSDNDVAGVTITESDNSTDVTEGSVTDTYTIVLDSQPTEDVTVTLSNGGQVDTEISVVFTADNWDSPQTITVTAIDDNDTEGDHSDTVSHAVTSDDDSYDGISAVDVEVNITDNDTPQVVITESENSTDVSEDGDTDTYTIVLTTQPTADVTVTLSTGSQVEGDVTTVVFTSDNWDTPQTVTISAIDDFVAEGDHTGTVSHTVTSDDADYDGLGADDVVVNVADNDTAGVVITESGGSTNVSEDGQTDTYTVVLTSQPTANVTVFITTGSELNSDPVRVTFTPENWDTPVEVVISAVDDNDVEGDHSFTITHPVTSPDGNYDEISVNSVLVNITDNDVAPPSDEEIYFSIQGNTRLNGLTVRNEDIVVFDGSDYSILFDGSDVGAAFYNIDAFDVINDTDILISFTTGGRWFDDSDILLFRATSLGETTRGRFYMYFDASDVGLTRSSEDVDALTFLDDGSFLISTIGTSRVDGGTFLDEDVFRFIPTRLGPRTAGTFEAYLDGSEPNFRLANNGGEDVDGFAASGNDLYLSTRHNFVVPGLQGDDDDIFTYSTITDTYGSIVLNVGRSDVSGIDFGGVASASDIGIGDDPSELIDLERNPIDPNSGDDTEAEDNSVYVFNQETLSDASTSFNSFVERYRQARDQYLRPQTTADETADNEEGFAAFVAETSENQVELPTIVERTPDSEGVTYGWNDFS